MIQTGLNDAFEPEFHEAETFGGFGNTHTHISSLLRRSG